MRLEDEIKVKEFHNQRHKLIVNILFTSSWLNGKQARFLKPYGISGQQYNVLRILRGQFPKPASVNLLIERMVDKQSNASRLVEKLRQKGLVARETCEADRRRVDVVITDKGLELLKEIDQKLYDYQEKLLAVTEDQALEINTMLDSMRG